MGSYTPPPGQANATVYNVMDFGAKGDGTDDSAAFQAVIDRIAAEGTGIMYLPARGNVYGATNAKYYYTATALTLPTLGPIHGGGAPAQNFVVIGDDLYNTMWDASNGINVAGCCTLRNLEISGNISLNPTVSGTKYEVNLDHVEMEGSCLVPKTSVDVRAVNCRFQYSSGWVMYYEGPGDDTLNLWMSNCEWATQYLVGGGGAFNVGSVSVTGGNYNATLAGAATPTPLEAGTLTGSLDILGVAGVATYHQGPQTILAGTTAGTAAWSQPEQGGSYKRFVLNLAGYDNTTAIAQTIAYPAAFTTVASVTNAGAPAGVATSLTTLTLPASMGAAVSGLVIVEGY